MGNKDVGKEQEGRKSVERPGSMIGSGYKMGGPSVLSQGGKYNGAVHGPGPRRGEVGKPLLPLGRKRK